MTEIDRIQLDQVARSLTKMGLLGDGERFAMRNLSGGVSCDVWRIEIDDRPPIVVKRALPKLRVAADWQAPPERSVAEVAWLRLAAKINPKQAPQILGEDAAHNMFAMSYLPEKDYPLWKAELAAGKIYTDFARNVGRRLAAIHSATAGRADIAAQFDNGVQFHALRIEPYLLFTAERNPDVAPIIRERADLIARARIALMQGDVSPKNILCGPDGPVFLDAETACYGDPAFDVAFCLNHLLLKSVWHPEYRDVYLKSFAALKDQYLRDVSWELPDAIETRTAHLLACFLLARIDGKSPVEYLTDPGDKSFVRAQAKALLLNGVGRLDTVAAQWNDTLLAHA